MRIFVTGASGLLGLNAVLQLRERHDVSGAYLTHAVKVPGIYRVNLTDRDSVERIFEATRPEVVLHTAGLTNVDACETNPQEARRLHVDMTGYVARAARMAGAKLIHISTDHLSDGTKAFAREDDTPMPVNEYAQTKWEAEQVAIGGCPDTFVIRTNFFGWGTRAKASFSEWILNSLELGKTVPLFMDVYVTPILINELVVIVEKLFERNARGIFNVVGRERVSKYEFGMRLARVFGYPTDRLRPVSVTDAPLRAPRPADMSLSCDKIAKCLGEPMPSLHDMLSTLKKLMECGWSERVKTEMEA